MFQKKSNDYSPNLGVYLLMHFRRQANQHKGEITCGDLITVLATHLGVNFANLRPFDGSSFINIATLKRVRLISESKDHHYYFHVLGAQRPSTCSSFFAPRFSSILVKFSWLNDESYEEEEQEVLKLPGPEEEEVEASNDSDDDANNYVRYSEVNQLRDTVDGIQSTMNAISTDQRQLQQHFAE